MDEKDKKRLAPRDLEDDFFGHLVEYVELWKERNHRIFAGKARSYQDFKLYLLRTLYSWSLVLGDGTYGNLLDFVDEISIESMRA